YYNIKANNQVTNFDNQTQKLNTKEINRRFELAKAYNRTLDPSRLSDPYTEKEKKGIAEYAHMLEIAEMIGYIDIPSIKQKLPIYAGTTSSVLEKGAGHLEGTSLPIGGKSSHTVITAHRGLPKAKLFTDLDKLKKGKIFYIHNIKEVLAYKVDQISVVKPDNFSKLLVVKGKDYATLLTCTPYSINSHRLLVRGHRIKYVPPVKEKNYLMKELQTHYKLYFLLSILVILILVALLLYLKRKFKERKRKGNQK
ncbi:PI-2a pilus assembly sortase SrtC4, partial [Streptococcus agalactiae]|nr:PI-2a pilus assembly sortase SrtC4 [Streptococcus agalactiae]